MEKRVDQKEVRKLESIMGNEKTEMNGKTAFCAFTNANVLSPPSFATRAFLTLPYTAYASYLCFVFAQA